MKQEQRTGGENRDNITSVKLIKLIVELSDALVVHKSDSKRVYSCLSCGKIPGDEAARHKPSAGSDERHTFSLIVHEVTNTLPTNAVNHTYRVN